MFNALHVLIPTHGRLDLLNRTLTSLAACEKPVGYRETVVVENGSRAGAEAVVQSHCKTLNARYIHVPQANKCNALNEALETIEDGLVVFLDDDIRLHPSTLTAYAEAAEGVHSGQYYGGPFGVDYEEEPPAWLIEYLPPSAKGWGTENGEPVAKWNLSFFLGFNWACFAEDIRDCGGFDPQFGPGAVGGGDESDVQKRLREGGTEPVYISQALVWHYVPAERCSPSWILERSFRHGVSWGVSRNDEGGWFGLKRWMINGYAYHGLRFLKFSMLKDERNRFDALYRIQKYKGVMFGFRKRFAHT